MRVLDLFSGIGGFSIGLERAGMKTVAFCEVDPYCCAVLKKHWPEVPIYGDVRTIPPIGGIDVICGGFPCQPFSHAGKQLGAEDDRHLWPAMLEVIKRERPTWVIGENVIGLIGMELDTVMADLEGAGYAVRTFAIPAVAVDAAHRRDRLWIVGHSNSQQFNVGVSRSREEGSRTDTPERVLHAGDTSHGTDDVADTNGKRGCSRDSERQDAMDADSRSESVGGSYARWGAEPGMGRVAYGIPNRAHRLRTLGNAVVPQIPEMIGRAIMHITEGNL